MGTGSPSEIQALAENYCLGQSWILTVYICKQVWIFPVAWSPECPGTHVEQRSPASAASASQVLGLEASAATTWLNCLIFK